MNDNWQAELNETYRLNPLIGLEDIKPTKSGWIVVAGGGVGVHAPTIAEAVRIHAKAQGIPYAH